MNNSAHFIHETDYPDFPRDAACAHLQEALRFPTVSHLDTAQTDYAVFKRFHAFLHRSYPHIASQAVWETVGHSLLIVLPGSDSTLLPILLMAHQDVVPVKSGTEKDWAHAPFSGDLADGYIWGRGALDIKEMLIGHLEAAEYLLSKGKKLKRTLYFAFGEDEETRSTGAMAICSLLMERQIRFALVLDEGSGDVADAADYGAPGKQVCTIGTYEKGYGDLRLTVRSKGGHSSNPFHGTSLGILASAIARILSNPPPPRLNDCTRSALQLLAPYITQDPVRGWLQDTQKHEDELVHWYMSKESLYHQVSTTIAPTMISEGAPAANVMPQDMSAVINFRFAPQDTPESVFTTCRSLLDSDIDLEWEQQIPASRPSRLDTGAFDALKQVLEHYFDSLIFIPVQNRGATDCRQYEPVSPCCFRFGPFLEEEDISSTGIHGTNERISVRAYLQGIRVLTRLIEQVCVKAEVLL